MLTMEKIIFYEDRNFQGRYHVCVNDSSEMRTYMSRCKSIKVLGGFWVVYERPNYIGHQYVLSPGEYPDYQYWLGINDAIRSCRVIRHIGNSWRMTIWEKPNFEGESLELTENKSTLDELWQSRDIHSCKVLEGAWIFYEHPNYRGRQMLLEKGEYRRYSEWGGRDSTVGSIRRVRS